MSAVIKCYQAYVDFLEDEGVYLQALAQLPPSRQEKAQRYYADKDRHLCVGAWLLLAYAMSLEGIDIADTEPLLNEQGKPSIAGAPNFSLSHSGNSVMCAVSWDCAVGCDAEKIKPWDEKLAKVCMQPGELEEMKELAARDSSSAGLSFFRRWTLKESYMKAKGLGFKLPPKSFAVELPKGAQPQIQSDEACSVVEYDLDDGFCYAACALASEADFLPLEQVALFL